MIGDMLHVDKERAWELGAEQAWRGWMMKTEKVGLEAGSV